jgi:hypothetical protein
MLPAIYGQLAAQNALSDPLLQAALAQNAAAVSAAQQHQQVQQQQHQQQQSAVAAAAAAAAAASASSDTSPTGSRDTMHTKIFVGGLPYHTTDKTLHDYFIQFGDIEEAVVITDRQTQKSRGYGFVTMKERSDAEKATRDPNPIIDGRKANVNLAYLGAKPRNNVQLAALSSLQLPIQTQLQAALFPAATAASRLGLPLMYPGATGATNPLFASLSQFQPALAAALASQAAQQQFIVSSQQSNSLNAALQQAQQHHQGAYFDYASLQAAANQSAAAAAAAGLVPQVSASNGIDQYGYPYGVIGTHPNLSHLNAAAQAQLAVAASGSGQMKLDNQH